MTFSFRLFLLIAALYTTSSCTTYKKVAYLQDAPAYTRTKIPATYEIKIEDDDMLAIAVNSRDTALALPFNHAPGGQGYLVSSDGNIIFPVFGELKVAGQTPSSLAGSIKERIIKEGYIKDPGVSVKLMNFKVSVMGEVNKPGVYPIPTQRITVLEAISLAGDMSIYGRRDRVLVVREEEGQREMHYLDVSSTDLFNSPYYYLRQNDLVYVEPNKPRAQQSEYNPRLPVYLAGASVLVSLASLIILIAK